MILVVLVLLLVLFLTTLRFVIGLDLRTSLVNIVVVGILGLFSYNRSLDRALYRYKHLVMISSSATVVEEHNTGRIRETVCEIRIRIDIGRWDVSNSAVTEEDLG